MYGASFASSDDDDDYDHKQETMHPHNPPKCFRQDHLKCTRTRPVVKKIQIKKLLLHATKTNITAIIYMFYISTIIYLLCNYHL